MWWTRGGDGLTIRKLWYFSRSVLNYWLFAWYNACSWYIFTVGSVNDKLSWSLVFLLFFLWKYELPFLTMLLSDLIHAWIISVWWIRLLRMFLQRDLQRVWDVDDSLNYLLLLLYHVILHVTQRSEFLVVSLLLIISRANDILLSDLNPLLYRSC